MHNYSNAQQFLESALQCRIEQDRLLERIGYMRTRVLKITPTLSAVPGGGNADAQALWVSLADEERHLTQLLQDELVHARRVEEFIDRMSTPMYKEVLKLRYLDFLTMPGVTQRLAKTGYHRSQRQVERLMRNALTEAEYLFNTIKGDYNHEHEQDDQQEHP